MSASFMDLRELSSQQLETLVGLMMRERENLPTLASLLSMGDFGLQAMVEQRCGEMSLDQFRRVKEFVLGDVAYRQDFLLPDGCLSELLDAGTITSAEMEGLMVLFQGPDENGWPQLLSRLCNLDIQDPGGIFWACYSLHPQSHRLLSCLLEDLLSTRMLYHVGFTHVYQARAINNVELVLYLLKYATLHRTDFHIVSYCVFLVGKVVFQDDLNWRWILLLDEQDLQLRCISMGLEFMHELIWKSFGDLDSHPHYKDFCQVIEWMVVQIDHTRAHLSAISKGEISPAPMNYAYEELPVLRVPESHPSVHALLLYLILLEGLGVPPTHVEEFCRALPLILIDYSNCELSRFLTELFHSISSYHPVYSSLWKCQPFHQRFLQIPLAYNHSFQARLNRILPNSAILQYYRRWGLLAYDDSYARVCRCRSINCLFRQLQQLPPTLIYTMIPPRTLLQGQDSRVAFRRLFDWLCPRILSLSLVTRHGTVVIETKWANLHTYDLFLIDIALALRIHFDAPYLFGPALIEALERDSARRHSATRCSLDEGPAQDSNCNFGCS